MCSSMGSGQQSASGSRINKAGTEVLYGNTKFTITQGKNGLYLNVGDNAGKAPTKKYKIAYAKDETKAKAYVGPFIGDVKFSDDPNMLKLLKNALKK